MPPETNLLQQVAQNFNQLSTLVSSMFENGAALTKSITDNVAKIDAVVSNAPAPAPAKTITFSKDTLIYAGLGLGLVALILWSNRK